MSIPAPIRDVLVQRLDRVRIPTDSTTQIHKDECAYCFHTQTHEGGLNVCLNTFLGFCPHHTMLHHEKTGNGVFLNIFKFKKPNNERGGDGEPPHKRPSLQDGILKGFPAAEEPEFETSYSLVLIDPKEAFPMLIQLPDSTLPEKVLQSVNCVIAQQSASRKQDLASLEEAEQIKESHHARSLVQLDNGVKVPFGKWQCSKCDITDNLWMNLTDGTILCGRRNWDGSGGNNHAVEYYQTTGFPLAVKLGTITPEGKADVYSYAEDAMVHDPLLKEHLAHFGLDVQKMTKTAKTLAEMELDANMRLDFSAIQEEGKKLVPLFGPGFTGIVNIGNSCYLSSIMQVLFSIPEFQTRYGSNVKNVFRQDRASDPTSSFQVQIAKFADGLLSGNYSMPRPSESEPGEQVQEGISPRMFKTLVGRGHPEFSTSQQQDAYEFFQYLLDYIQRQEHAAARPMEADPSRLFTFAVQEKVMDTKSGRVRYNHRTDNGLSLHIPLEKAVNRDEYEAFLARQESLSEEERKKLRPEEIVRLQVPLTACLDCFAHEELIEDFYSTFLKERTTAIKTTRLESFPDYLVIHLRKYYIENRNLKKLDVFVDVPDVLDLADLYGSGPQPGEELLPDEEEELPKINESIASMLVEMGFPLIRAQKAAIACATPDQAMEWIFAHNEDPDIDSPISTKKKSPDAPSPSSEDIQTLMAMGFSDKQAVVALQNTSNNVERAVDWLFSHANDEMVDVNARSSSAAVAAPPTNGAPRYRLFAFVSHMGANLQTGHYVCHILKDGKWVICNDNKVALSEAPPRRMGYLYFYRRSAD